MSLLLVRYEFPGKRVLSALIDLPLSVSPVVVGLALVLVYNGRDGWFGPTLEEAGSQVIFATPGMIMATCFVALPLVIREVVPVLTRSATTRSRPPAASAPTRRRPSGGSPCPASSGRSCTASCSAWPAPSVSSARSRSCPATSPARPRPPPSWSSRSTRTSSRTAYATSFLLVFVGSRALIVVALLRPKRRGVREGEHEHRRLRRHQEVRRLRRPRRRHRVDAHRPADRPARARRVAASPRCCGSSPASTRPTPAPSPSRASTPRSCRRRSATSASCSSTTRSSST